MFVFLLNDFVLSINIYFGNLVTFCEDKGQYSIYSALMFQKNAASYVSGYIHLTVRIAFPCGDLDLLCSEVV